MRKQWFRGIGCLLKISNQCKSQGWIGGNLIITIDE